MTRKLFGTDGVRGRANAYPMTADMALKLGAAAGEFFRTDGRNGHRVVIGKDTRRSGYMIETALTAGLASTGMNVLLLGPVPTPAVGYLTRSMRADLGIMISASHNPYYDNGIKFFGPDGFKLSDDAERAIEKIVEGPVPLAESDAIGSARRIDDARGRYVEYVKTTFPGRGALAGLKIVVDCANGAIYKAAPEALWELGAEVIAIGVSPNGFNINENCGSTHPETCAARVVAEGAHLGITLDGDADRVMIIDETGKIADGDQIMALFAARWAAEGRLHHNTLVATVMSNLGLEHYLGSKSIRLERTPVGDRYVVEAMRRGGWNLGGEQSGHIVMTDYATTGDGLIAGLHFLGEMVQTGLPASELVHSFERVPQLLQNVRYGDGQEPLNAPEVQAIIAASEVRLNGCGRLLIRKSGTEPLVRVMAECTDEALLADVVGSIVAEIRARV
ncbi:MAG: phosphoglucosamine mutase [Rhodobacteraceae bacterium]|nr:phosphoglucosamine mutase [Paracoccaceae bacterium]